MTRRRSAVEAARTVIRCAGAATVILSSVAPRLVAQTTFALPRTFAFQCGARLARHATSLAPSTPFSNEHGFGFRAPVVSAPAGACATDHPFLFGRALPEGNYLFAYFKGNGEDGMHLAHSVDGLTWRALNHDSALFKPTVGTERLTRDPSIVRGPDGTYHMVWTTGWNEHGFGYAHSTDLISWTGERYVPAMAHEPTALNSWAPELLYDAPNRRFLIYWATTIPGRNPATDSTGGGGKYNHRIFYVSTTDFTSFTPARLLYDHGFSVIDADIVRDGARYVMFLKNETERPPEKNIRLAFADRAEGPWSGAHGADHR